MTEEAKKYLYDILQAIGLIEDFVKETGSFLKYQEDLKTKSAVERQLGIIGEAISKFKKVQSDIEFGHTHQIIAVRNRIVHSYDTLDDAIIWTILKRHLPLLKSEVEKVV